MAAETEHPSADINSGLQASHFSLFQLIRQLRTQSPDCPIQLRPALHRSIQQGEVYRAFRQGTGWCVEVNLPGLYGSSSPLPAYITELLLQQEQLENSAPRALLDLFNQRLYELQLETDSKNYPAIQLVEEGNNLWISLATRLLGIPAERLAILPRRDWLFRHFQLLTHPYPTAAGLAKLVSSWLQEEVCVEQCVLRQVALETDSQTQLGRSNHQLGKSSLVGNRINDRNSKLRLKIGPLDHEHFSALIRDRKTWRTLRTLINVYLRSPYECELEFVLNAPQEVESLTLGGLQWGHLGRNAWLLSSKKSETPACLVAQMPLI